MGGRGAASGTVVGGQNYRVYQGNPEEFFNLHQMPATLTDAEKGALTGYSSSGGNSIVNSFLRRPDQPWPARTRDNAERITSLIDTAMGKSTLKESVTLYRGMLMTPRLAEALEGRLVPGAMIEDKAFASTSIFPGSSFNQTMNFVIKAKKGSRALPVYHISGNRMEYEVLLPRNSRFRVLSVRKAGQYAGEDVTEATVELL
jgi:hypothetical protein